MPNNVLMGPFSRHISRLSPKEIFDLRKRVDFLLDCDALNLPIDKLLVFEYELDDDWHLLLCDEDKFKADTIAVMNKVTDYYNLDFHVREVNVLTIVVVDSDNTYLTDELPMSGVTLWHNVDDFISDTQYHADYYHNDDSIETYDDAVKYWEEMLCFHVLSNYVDNDLEKMK